ETDLGAGADRETRLRRIADEAAVGGAGAGGDGRDLDGNLDRYVDRVAVFVDTGSRGLSDAFDNARRKDETGSADGAESLDPADGETAGCEEQGVRQRRHAEPRAQLSKPLQFLRHSRGHRRIEAGRADRRIAGR